MRSLIVLSALFLSAPALAEEVIGGPGEQPVEAYTITNENAGAAPLANPKVLAAFNGEAGINRVVDRMVDLSVADPRISDIFQSRDLVRLRRTLKEQFGYLLGAPVAYTGRDMKTAHKDMGLQTRDLNLLIEHLRIAMREEKVPFWAQNKLLAVLAPMKRDVVAR
jgi:hemoglobin